jgi:hypothetical protein
MPFLPAIMSVLLLSACATTAGYEKKVNVWSGQPADQLVKNWGKPDLILILKNDNKEYQYLKDQVVTIPQQDPDPFADHLASLNEALSRQNDPLTSKNRYWGNDSVSPSFSLSPTQHYTTIQKTLYCYTFFEIGPNGRIISVRFNGNHCLA